MTIDDPGGPVAPDGSRMYQQFVPVLAAAAALSAVLGDSGSALDDAVVLAAIIPFVVWMLLPSMPTLVLVVATSAATFFAARNSELEASMFMLSIAATVVGAYERSRIALVVGALVLTSVPPLGAILYDNDTATGVWIMGVLLPLGISRISERQLELASELAAARATLADQRVLEERRRIARDVHDSVGHGLAAVLLHITGARHVLRRDPDAADEALAEAEQVGRRSMMELRETLGMLRTETDGGTTGAPQPPVPGVDAMRRDEIWSRFTVTGDVSRLDPLTATSLHRVAEEAFANATRHAPGAATSAVLDVRAHDVVMTIESFVDAPACRDDEEPRPRYGIVGMSERMAAVGGAADGVGMAGAGGRPATRRRGQRGRAVIRVALVDDQAIIRTGVARILSPHDGFEVVAEYEDGADAVAGLTDGMTVDVVVMDIRMPRLDGIAATRQLREQDDAPAVIVLTTFDEDDLLWSAVEAGASGFVLKDASAGDLIAAVRAVAGGGAWFDPSVAPRLLETYRRVVAPSRRTARRVDDLTEREHEVLVLMARGATNAEIADQLYVSEATVKTHVGKVFMKLGARDRAAAIVFAYDHGIVP